MPIDRARTTENSCCTDGQTQGRLTPQESETLVRLARVLATASYILGSDEEARRFLYTPDPKLRNSPPADLSIPSWRRDSREHSLACLLWHPPTIAYRIGDARLRPHRAFLHGGPWNSPGRWVIYAGDSLALAMLEVLIHTHTGRIPPRHALMEIGHTLTGSPSRSSTPPPCPGWDASDELASRADGDHWHAAQRTAVLVVPSVVTWKTAPNGRNLLLNQDDSGCAGDRTIAAEVGDLGLASLPLRRYAP